MRRCVLYGVSIVQHFVLLLLIYFIFRFLIFKKKNYGHFPKLLKRILILKKKKTISFRKKYFDGYAFV